MSVHDDGFLLFPENVLLHVIKAEFGVFDGIPGGVNSLVRVLKGRFCYRTLSVSIIG